ncbi:hypothetical protein [Lentzea sp. NPDC059081]|uniref:hypothetical protein n=1 Tax=Lentzea sp. NPDC059081 TaxID=3346719 RepID=UPI0036CF91F6
MIKKAIVLGAAIAGMGLFASTAHAAPSPSRDVLDTQLVGPISITALSHNPWTPGNGNVNGSGNLGGNGNNVGNNNNGGNGNSNGGDGNNVGAGNTGGNGNNTPGFPG